MTNYKTPQAFMDLYFDFTGYTHPNYPSDRTAIAQDLAAITDKITDSNTPGSLIVATATGIYVYDSDKDHTLLSSSSFRATQDSGFYEVTGISHLGPAIAYLATIKEMKKDQWKTHIGPLLKHVQEVKAVNAIPLEQNWLTALACPAWKGRESAIRNMINYACLLAEHYLLQIQNDPEKLTSENAVRSFLAIESDAFPIPFNTIMIGTFAVAALSSIYAIYRTLTRTPIDWKNAKIILHNQAGTNYGAGLTAGSNWLHSVICTIAGASLNPDRIIIAPYAIIPDSVGHDHLTKRDYQILSEEIWGAIYSRPLIANRVFSYIDNIVLTRHTPIPGDYGFTQAHQIDHFLMRLKFSTGNIKEMLSNTVGFWISQEAAAKNWQLEKMDLPGLTHGLPAGLQGYPAIK